MIKRSLSRLVGAIERIRIGSQKFAIVSNNCWGSEAYTACARPYNTPFVGLFLYPDCYLKFLENFNDFLSADIEFEKRSRYFAATPKYPVGHLNGQVEIHFLHYPSEEEADEKWKRRTSRLQEEITKDVKIFFKLCDREDCTTQHLQRFHALPFSNKISLGLNPFPVASHLCVPHLSSKTEVSVINGLSLFRKRYKYFDFAKWIVSGHITKTLSSKLLGLIS